MWHRPLYILGVLLMVLSLASCSSSAASPTASQLASQAASQQATVPATPTSSPSPNDLLAKIKDQGFIRLSTLADDPGSAVLKPDGTYEGLDIWMGEQIAKEIGVQIQYVTPAWSVMTAGSWGGRWDLSVQAALITGSRLKVLSFSDPYRYTVGYFAVKKGSTITSVDQLAGKTICVATGSTYQLYLMGQLDATIIKIAVPPPANTKIVTFESETQCAQGWASGRNDWQAFLTGDPTIHAAIAAGLPIQKIDTPIYYAPGGVAADKSGPDPTRLLAIASAVIKRCQGDGSLKAESIKFFTFDVTSPPSP